MTRERRNPGTSEASRRSSFRRPTLPVVRQALGLSFLAAAVIYTLALLMVLIVSQQDQRRQADDECADTQEDARGLEGIHVKQRRQRGLADDEPFRQPPPRQARLCGGSSRRAPRVF